MTASAWPVETVEAARPTPRPGNPCGIPTAPTVPTGPTARGRKPETCYPCPRSNLLPMSPAVRGSSGTYGDCGGRCRFGASPLGRSVPSAGRCTSRARDVPGRHPSRPRSSGGPDGKGKRPTHLHRRGPEIEASAWVAAPGSRRPRRRAGPPELKRDSVPVDHSIEKGSAKGGWQLRARRARDPSLRGARSHPPSSFLLGVPPPEGGGSGPSTDRAGAGAGGGSGEGTS